MTHFEFSQSPKNVSTNFGRIVGRISKNFQKCVTFRHVSFWLDSVYLSLLDASWTNVHVSDLCSRQIQQFVVGDRFLYETWLIAIGYIDVNDGCRRHVRQRVTVSARGFFDHKIREIAGMLLKLRLKRSYKVVILYPLC